MPCLRANGITDSVDHRFAQIRLQRIDVARLEQVQPLERPIRGLLHEIIGVERTARVQRQASVCPSLD